MSKRKQNATPRIMEESSDSSPPKVLRRRIAGKGWEDASLQKKRSQLLEDRPNLAPPREKTTMGRGGAMQAMRTDSNLAPTGPVKKSRGRVTEDEPDSAFGQRGKKKKSVVNHAVTEDGPESPSEHCGSKTMAVRREGDAEDHPIPPEKHPKKKKSAVRSAGTEADDNSSPDQHVKKKQSVGRQEATRDAVTGPRWDLVNNINSSPAQSVRIPRAGPITGRDVLGVGQGAKRVMPEEEEDEEDEEPPHKRVRFNGEKGKRIGNQGGEQGGQGKKRKHDEDTPRDTAQLSRPMQDFPSIKTSTKSVI